VRTQRRVPRRTCCRVSPAEFFNLLGLAEWAVDLGEVPDRRGAGNGHDDDREDLARRPDRDRWRVGDIVVVDVDMTVLIDMQFRACNGSGPTAFTIRQAAVGHGPCVPAPTIRGRGGGPGARRFGRRLWVSTLLRRRPARHCHQVIAENGLARPGEVLACTDSHTCAAGAYNTAARGLGPAEIYSIMCTGNTWFQIAPDHPL